LSPTDSIKLLVVSLVLNLAVVGGWGVGSHHGLVGRWQESAGLQLGRGGEHHLHDADRYAYTQRARPNGADIDDCTDRLTLCQISQRNYGALGVVRLGTERTVEIRQNLEVQGRRVPLLGRLDDRLVLVTLNQDGTGHLLAQESLGILLDEIQSLLVNRLERRDNLGLVQTQGEGPRLNLTLLILEGTQPDKCAKLRQLENQLATASRVQVDRLATALVGADVAESNVGSIESREHAESHLYFFYYTHAPGL